MFTKEKVKVQYTFSKGNTGITLGIALRGPNILILITRPFAVYFKLSGMKKLHEDSNWSPHEALLMKALYN